MTSPESLLLQTADSRVTICPQIGASIARYTWREHDILRPAPEAAIRDRRVRHMACYPLVPYSNRIGQAVLVCGEKRHTLRANAPPEAHALHGFGWQREWQIHSHSGNATELRLVHQSDGDWPFACEAIQTLQLMEDALHMNLMVRNTDSRPMPAGLGFHPYFPISRETTLQTDWTSMWEMGADSLPTAPVKTPAEADFHQAQGVSGWKVDNCFTGWSGRATLDCPTHQTQIVAGSTCRHVVCFSPNDGRQFLALEPVTHINNAFALAAKGVSGTGMKMLAAGESFEASMAIQVVSH